MAAGVHIVRKLRPGRPVLWYVYAFRGGPLVHRAEGTSRPKMTPALVEAVAVARKHLRETQHGETIQGLIQRFEASAEWAKLAPKTQQGWATWLKRISEKFGTAPLSVFNSRRARGLILDWRDQWADKPRTADVAVQVLRRLLSHAVKRGELDTNIAEGIGELYEANRSEVVWTDSELAALIAAAPVEVGEGAQLAALTGLRRGDLVKLPWSAVGDHAIVWRTAKSRGRNLVTIPLLPETRALLKRIKARQEAVMQARRADKRTELPPTVLLNSWLRSWTAMGFGGQFNDARDKAAPGKHLHDLRGTFATRLMIAGLTDDQIADILGWASKDVASIRSRYVDQARVVVAIGERLAKAAAG